MASLFCVVFLLAEIEDRRYQQKRKQEHTHRARKSVIRLAAAFVNIFVNKQRGYFQAVPRGLIGDEQPAVILNGSDKRRNKYISTAKKSKAGLS